MAPFRLFSFIGFILLLKGGNALAGRVDASNFFCPDFEDLPKESIKPFPPILIVKDKLMICSMQALCHFKSDPRKSLIRVAIACPGTEVGSCPPPEICKKTGGLTLDQASIETLKSNAPPLGRKPTETKKGQQ
ncbi:MAG: hypothetical protein KGP28_00410 [Bdellovibrionales bacterium]|nr:hypothetical protein [Bdellovibrionales bacterium]